MEESNESKLQQAQALINVLENQRNSALNQVAQLSASLEIANATIKSLSADKVQESETEE